MNKHNFQKLVVFLIIAFSNFQIINLAAQAPQAFPYQSVLRDASGNLLANQNVTLRFSILSGGATGTLVYQETQTATTNNLGLFDVNIGQGNVTNGTFANINWGSGSKYLKVELDATGGSNYVQMDNAQLLSVPYALYAGGSNSTNTTHYIGESYGGGIVFYVYDNGQHGLIAAPSDLPGEITGPYQGLIAACWPVGNPGFPKGDGFGAGHSNTVILYSMVTCYSDPVRGCLDYQNSMNGISYGDWYLPSVWEMNKLYEQKLIIPGLITSSNMNCWYWTSTFVLPNNYIPVFSMANGTIADPNSYYHVRPIRKF